MRYRKIKKHLKDQNWTAVVIDFVIVVVGIWVALLVSEWSENRQQRSDLARVEKDMSNEIATAYFYAHERLATAPCRKARYAELGELLLEPGPGWPGKPGGYGDGVLTKHRVFAPVLRSPVRPWSRTSWELASNQGVLDFIDPARREALSNHYSQMVSVRDMQTRVYETESRLQILARPIELSVSDRLRYYDVLSEADALNAGIELLAEQMIARIEGVPLLVPTAEQKAAMQAVINSTSGSAFAVYGECREAIEMRLLNQPEPEPTS